MKEELQGKLVEILTSIQSAAGKASDFAMEQLPDIAQSYVAYGRAVGTLAVVIPLIVLVAGWLIAWRVYLYKKDKESYYDPFRIMFPAILLSGLCLLSVVVATPQALLVWFAPKVWLLKEIAGLIK